MNHEQEDPQLALFRLLDEQPNLSQRQLPQALGSSLGKTHCVLHPVPDCGLIKGGGFRRSDTKLTYAYIRTPTVLRGKLRLKRAFLSHTEAEFEHLQPTIIELENELVSAAKHAPLPRVRYL